MEIAQEVVPIEVPAEEHTEAPAAVPTVAPQAEIVAATSKEAPGIEAHGPVKKTKRTSGNREGGGSKEPVKEARKKRRVLEDSSEQEVTSSIRRHTTASGREEVCIPVGKDHSERDFSRYLEYLLQTSTASSSTRFEVHPPTKLRPLVVSDLLHCILGVSRMGDALYEQYEKAKQVGEIDAERKLALESLEQAQEMEKKLVTEIQALNKDAEDHRADLEEANRRVVAANDYAKDMEAEKNKLEAEKRQLEAERDQARADFAEAQKGLGMFIPEFRVYVQKESEKKHPEMDFSYISKLPLDPVFQAVKERAKQLQKGKSVDGAGSSQPIPSKPLGPAEVTEEAAGNVAEEQLVIPRKD